MDNKIYRLTYLMNKMNVKMDKCDLQFKPQIYQRNRRGQNRHNYNQNDLQTRNRSFSRDRGASYRGRGNFVQNYRQNYRGRPRDNYRGDYGRDNYTGQRYRNRSDSRDNCRDNYRDNFKDDCRRDNNLDRERSGMRQTSLLSRWETEEMIVD